MTCSVENCGTTGQMRKGMCAKHYERMRRTGSTALPEKPTECAYVSCPKSVDRRGYCTTHYVRFWKTGSPEPAAPLVGENSPSWRGGERRLRGDGYVVVYVPYDHPFRSKLGAQEMEHRLMMMEHLGRLLLPDENVHHINGVKDDNRIENLELWTRSQPTGQRVEDKLAWCREFIQQYGEIA